MNGKDYLRQIKKLDTQIKNKNAEVKILEANGGFGIPAIGAEMERLAKAKAKIIKTIEELSEAEYDVLHKVYVQGESLYEVAADRGISYSLATTIHGKALKNLENLINK